MPALSPALRRLVQAMSAAYDAIDLRIETTLGRAETDLLAALPVMDGYEAELRELADLLIGDLRQAIGEGAEKPVLLRFAYQDQDDLLRQCLANSHSRQVILPIEDDSIGRKAAAI